MPTDYGYFEEKSVGKPYDVKMLKRLYPFTKPYKLLLICSVTLVIFITLLDLSLPYVTKIAIDRYILPVQGFGMKLDNEKKTGETRYLKVDLKDEEIKAVVQKYQDQFRQLDTVALISFDALPNLAKEDIFILRKNDIAGLGWIAAVFLFIVLANFGLNFLQVMLMEYSGQMIMHDLRSKLFEHIQGLSVAFFTRNPVGRLVTRVTNDIQNMHELFTSVISFVFKDMFLLLGIAIVLLSLNWKLALVSFIVLPFVNYASLKFSRHAREAFRVIRIKIAEINTKISETLAGISVIQLFGHEKENYTNFKKLNHEHYRAGMRQIQILAVFMPTIELLGVVALAIVIFYGGSGVLSGSLSLGALVAFISYVKMFFRPIRDIAEKYNILQNAMASAERIFLILDNKEKLPLPVDIKVQLTASQEKINDIVMKDVSFSYISGELILKQMNLRIQAGDVLAVVGPTGSGKTSLINLIPRFYDPTAGQVLINSCDIKYIQPSALRAKIALVTQDPFLFSLSIRDNIIPDGDQMMAEEMEYILKASNCKPLIEKLPKGLDTVLSEGGSSISSGERQLLSIARAFAHSPDLIIFDEATSYIDSETEQKIQEALFNLMKNRTAIIVAHRLTTARKANRIIVLNRGRIIETGSHQELIEKKGFYFRLSRLQG
jgi:ATP-binding cassette subfamily B protein